MSGWHTLAAMGGRKAPKLPEYLASLGLIERQKGVKTGKVRVTPADRERARRNAESVREAFRRRPAE